MVALATWSSDELAAWRPPDHLTGTEWSERYRVLPKKGNAEPGKFRMDRTPFMRAVLDCLTDGWTQYITLCKGVQISGSTQTQNAVGAWVDMWGDPILIVYPTEASAKEQLTDKVKPLLTQTKRLSRWLTGERNAITKEQIDLAHCTIYLGWSGSAQTVASRAIRCVILDETDKYQRDPNEAAPSELADLRTTTYTYRRKVFELSTPTSRVGHIWTSYEQTPDRRKWHVPCPRCEELSELVWEQVSCPGIEAEDPKELLQLLAALDEGEVDARYVLPCCGYTFDETERSAIVARGQWVSEGREPGDLPKSVRVAFHISALYSPWVSLNKLCTAYIKCALKGDLHNFLNGYLALPYEDADRAVEGQVLLDRASSPPGLVPPWATCITSGADTQKDHWWYVVRAWGPGKGGLRSQLLAYGRANSTAELKQVALDTSFPIEGAPGHYMRPNVLMVDSGGGVETEAQDGTTRDVVYEFALSDPLRVIPVKGYGGHGKPDYPIKQSTIKYSPRSSARDPRNVNLQILDTQALKDRLSYLIRCNDPVLWEECSTINEDYAVQMSSEVKIAMKIGRTMVKRWRQKGHTPNHLWDSSVYCLAGAVLIRAGKREAQVERQIKKTAEAPRQRTRKQSSFVRPGQRSWISKR